MIQDTFTQQELAQAERLEQYLNNLEGKTVVMPDATAADVELCGMARQFHAWQAQLSRLAPPLKQHWSLKKILSWAIPLPVVATAAMWFVLWKTSSPPSLDITTELAVIEQTDADLLAIEEELNTALSEIDLLTSTDYIDQL